MPNAEELESLAAGLDDNASFEEIEALVQRQLADQDEATQAAKPVDEARAALDAVRAAETANAEKPAEVTPPAAAAAVTTVETPPGETAAAPVQQESGEGPIVGPDGKTLIPYGVLHGTRRDLGAARAKLLELEQQAATDRTAREAAEAESIALRAQLAEAGKASKQDVKDVQAQVNAAGVTDAQGRAVDVLTIDTAKLREEYEGPIVDVIEALQKAVNASNATVRELQDRQTVRDREAAVGRVDDVQKDIDAVPALSDWQVNHAAKWAAAVAMDQALMTDPAWKDKPRVERFAHVAKELGGAAAPPANNTSAALTTQQTAPAAGKTTVQDVLAKAAKALPGSHSDLPAGSPASQSENESLEGLSVEQVNNKFAGMTADQIDQLLARIG